MNRLPARLLLLVVCLAAMGAAGFVTWTLERDARTRDAADNQFTAYARDASVSVANLRAAQQAYVAIGQGPDFWFTRTEAIVKDVEGKLSALKPLAAAPEAATAIDEASSALQDFEQMDRRVRDFVRGRQTAQASDLIFADGFDLTKKAGDAIERAVTAELTDRDGVLGFLRRRETYVLAGAGGMALLVLVLLVPVRREAASATPSTSLLQLDMGSAVSNDTLGDLDTFGMPPRKTDSPRPSVSMENLAAICSELARVTDTRALPALLERVATLLNASGIVVWIADPDGRELSPILVHGYSPQLATRLGTILRDAANVTAAAYRTGLTQTVKGDTISNGAIASPLLSPAGPLGVMAAEMNNGGEQQEILLGAAAIIASQIATLVGPPSVRASRTEAAG
jgi:hypothetical protein